MDPLARHWNLDPATDYLNHGSFGACPSTVLEAQAAWRSRLERDPFRFLARKIQPLLDDAREALARFVVAAPEDVVFVTNATTGVNTVLRSLDLSAGDEILITDHIYPACRKAADFTVSRTGARLVVASVPFPVDGDDAVIDAVVSEVTPRTRVALLDHVASPTALVFPVERLVRELSTRGVDVLVDGAHAPGAVPLDLTRLEAAWYTGNGHKWLCAPKGAAFLHARRDRQSRLHPLVISHGYGAAPAGRSALHAEFDWTGTFDPTPWLCVPEAIRFMGSLLPGGWPELMARNRALALRAREIVGTALGVEPACPASMVASMASIPLPRPAPGSAVERLDHEALMDRLYERHAIETWLYPWTTASGKLVRVAAQAYNDEPSYHRLARALIEEAGLGGSRS